MPSQATVQFFVESPRLAKTNILETAVDIVAVIIFEAAFLAVSVLAAAIALADVVVFSATVICSINANARV